MKKSKWFDRLGNAVHAFNLIILLVAGGVGAWLLGGICDMGLKGYVIGFTIGVAVAFGTVS